MYFCGHLSFKQFQNTGLGPDFAVIFEMLSEETEMSVSFVTKLSPKPQEAYTISGLSFY